MANSLSSSSTTIVEAANHFCARLTQACAKMRQKIEAEIAGNQRKLAVWDAGNRVDNPDPLGFNNRMGGMPSRTFRYGMPPLEISGATVQTMPVVSFAISRNSSSSFRTPAEQAREVVAKKSGVCWSGHMSGKAKHVLPTVNGKAIADGDEFEKLLGPNLSWFKTLWVSELDFNGLRDAGGGKSWFRTPRLHDQLHVELPNSKIGQGDPHAKACVEEYARLVDLDDRNQDFEDALEPNLVTVLNDALAKRR